MSTVFGSTYAGAYDALYADKDYAAECALIRRLIGDYGPSQAKSILDMGSGTGQHSIPLSKLGYEVVGVDLSPDMAAFAKGKAEQLPQAQRPRFVIGDVRTVDLGRKFDVALMMFAVLGYQTGNDDVLSALKTVRRHLPEGGLFLFDVWYGPAVLHEGPSERIKETRTTNGKILRAVHSELFTNDHLCAVNYRLWHWEADRLISETTESHKMRYFFPLELDLFCAQANLRMVKLGAFPDFDREPDQTTWNVMGVARAV